MIVSPSRVMPDPVAPRRHARRVTGAEDSSCGPAADAIRATRDDMPGEVLVRADPPRSRSVSPGYAPRSDERAGRAAAALARRVSGVICCLVATSTATAFA